MKNIKWKPLLISLAINLAIYVVSGLITYDSMDTYSQLYKPPLSPPGWLFPIVWGILFLLMAIAAYLIIISDSPNKKNALKIYFFQLGANVIWSVIFFRLDAYVLAFAWLLLLWYLVYLTIKAFKDISKTAAYLLIPYIVWITFAAYLNVSIAIYYLK